VTHLLDTNTCVDHLRHGPASNVIALANSLTLVTHNTSEFNRVPGLKLEDWQ
jgi:predicted nucleic acid-binding protein